MTRVFGSRTHERTLMVVATLKDSMQQLKVALKINPADSRASTLMVQVLRSQGKFDEAKTEVERALNCEGKKTPRLYGEWCALALDMGDHTEALKIAEKTVELFPHHAEGYLWKGDLLYRDGRFEEAIAEYTRCMSSQGMRGTPQVSRGRAYLALGQLDKALDDINQALQAVQGMYGDGWIFKSRGEIHFRMGNFDKALADMREAVRRKDFSALRWIPFAEIASCPDAAFRAGMFQLSNEAIRLGEAEGYVFRGMVQAESNDVAKAILEFRKAAESDPDNFYFSYLNALAQLAARRHGQIS